MISTTWEMTEANQEAILLRPYNLEKVLKRSGLILLKSSIFLDLRLSGKYR